VIVDRDWFRNTVAVTGIGQVGVDRRLVVYGGGDEQQCGEHLVCPWWRFPLHLCAWLESHDALPSTVDADAPSARLVANFGPTDIWPPDRFGGRSAVVRSIRSPNLIS